MINIHKKSVNDIPAFLGQETCEEWRLEKHILYLQPNIQYISLCVRVCVHACVTSHILERLPPHPQALTVYIRP